MDVSLSSALTATTVRASKPGEPVEAQGRATEQGDIDAIVDEAERQPLEQAMSDIEGFVQNIRRDLDFALDDSSGRMVVKVTDRASGNVVRQIPSEEALRLAENLEQMRSLLFEAQA